MYISKNLAYLRKKADYTQEKLAYILRVGRASISNYEEDATKISCAYTPKKTNSKNPENNVFIF